MDIPNTLMQRDGPIARFQRKMLQTDSSRG